ncbi:hypothetical protein GCM10022222_15480 [Amycolatopsis ultiminotia]|uniref:PPE domain-containing protein n=1 Tax=Amycolatopsis ultiminotia TaxID=543629 RepID=A0ABP6VFM3_9PSEU
MSRKPAYERLPYEKHRKHETYRQEHPLSAAQRRRVNRTRKIQRKNEQTKSFGKINWSAYNHRQLYDMIMTADPAAMGSDAHSWAQLALNVDASTAAVHKTVQKLLLSWRGGAAGGAAQSASKLTTWGAGASETMRKVGDDLDHYTNAVTTARNKMPEPVFYSAENQFRDGYDVNAASGPSGAVMVDQLLDDHLPAKKKATQAKTEAVRVMEHYESTSKGVHDRLPHFTDAPMATRSDDAGSGGSGGGAGSGSGGGSGDDSTTTSSSDPSGSGGMPGLGGPGSGAGAPGSIGAGGAGGAGSGLGSGAGSGALPGGALGSQGGGAPAVGAAQSAAGARSGLNGGFFPPMGGAQRGGNAGEHQNRYAKGGAFDFLEDMPAAYPPVLGE